ncbi:conserved hypothetical protein [Ricinus communis]|uniref:WAT1-related protein n=1 Tax=Ricinus communis TaxID=3988 RepID=B9S340_RICCO|nr:conserved hypothetical protein [Ricinus communis]
MANHRIFSDRMRLLLALFSLQLCYSGFHIVSRVALNIGVSKIVYPVYRNIIALLLLGPIAYFLEKKGKAPSYSRSAGPVLPPSITRNHGKSRILSPGTVLCISYFCSSNAKLSSCSYFHHGFCFRAPILKKYPAKLTVTSFTCFFGLVQFLGIAAFVETDLTNWKIQSGEELFTILYAGIVASSIIFSLQTWCIDKGGPVFVAIFQPMQTLLVAIMASLILGDQLYFGRIIGAILIMLGLYSVLWGKSEEKRVETDEKPETLTRTS